MKNHRSPSQTGPHPKKTAQPIKIIKYLIGMFLALIVLTYSINTLNHLLQKGDEFLAKNKPSLAAQSYRVAQTLYPLSPSPHQRLSSVFMYLNDWDNAKRELTLARELNPHSQELAAQQNKIDEAHTQPQKIQEQINSWTTLVTQKPDYRDAYIELSLLSYQRYQNSQALQYLAKAKSIDPNNPTIAKLETLFSK